MASLTSKLKNSYVLIQRIPNFELKMSNILKSWQCKHLKYGFLSNVWMTKILFMVDLNLTSQPVKKNCVYKLFLKNCWPYQSVMSNCSYLTNTFWVQQILVETKFWKLVCSKNIWWRRNQFVQLICGSRIF